MGCAPAVLVDDFPILIACDNGYWLFQRMMGDTPVYSFIPTGQAVNLAYRYRGEYRKRGMEERIKILDDFIKFWLPIEHRQAPREVMKTALHVFHKLKNENPELGLGKVLLTAWKVYREKGHVTPEEVEEELSKEMVLA